jgi:hypothetical protein
MKKLWLLILVCASANANDRYPEKLAADDIDHFWQLTLVTQGSMIDISPDAGYAFRSRVACIKDGLRRAKIAAVPLTEDDWGAYPLLGFICEYTRRADPNK